MTEETPSLLHGRYEVVAVVGRGGEGTLVRAVDRRHGRDVALKVRRVPGDPRDAERMLVESRTLLSLRPFPGLPLARDDFFEGDRHVLVMDWVDGLDLWAVLTEHGRPGLPPSTVLRWLAPVAEALTHLHTSDPPVVHGDVKPANLVLTPAGQVVLVDFGASSSRSVRQRGGTRGYRAPEVAAGGLPTRSADVYGLAATAFALLSGEPPTGILPSWEDIDRERAARLEQALRRGLAIDPAHRTTTPGELIEELRSGWDTEPLPTGVLTFLATDVVSSTRLWQDTPDMAPGLLAEHLLVVDRAVERHGGRRVGRALEGDATISVFHRAGDAVRAGVDLQRDLIGARLQVHCAAHTGEAIASDGSYVGTTLSRVARIRALADAGQVLVSATTARLVAGDLPAEMSFIALGPHRLAGFDEPEALVAVQAEGLAVPPDPSRPPYPGLAPFESGDHDLFFGREELADGLMARFAARHVVAVVGGSGSGKSSLVRAGIVPRLADAQLITPGDHPMAVLATVGEGPLVVDQLEEVFTICDDVHERAMFADRLVDHPGGCVVAVRADLYGHLADCPRLAAVVAADHVLLGRLEGEPLRRAIEGPAELRGLRLEPGLTEVILADAQTEPGALPLIAHALSETWLRREGRTLTIAGYRAAGGVRGALAQTAEQLYTALGDDDRDILRAVLLRMVEPGEGATDTKRRVVRVELTALGTSGEVDGVLERLAAARLVSLDHDTAEPAHEALLREWPRLRAWIDEDRGGLRLLGRLSSSAHEWDRLGRDPAELQRGARQAAVLEWVEETHPALDDIERDYLDACRAAEEAELRAARERARRDARAKRRLQSLLAATAVLLVGVVLAGLLAVRQRNRADTAGSLAEARRIGTQALVVDGYDKALLLALEGRHLNDSLETNANLLGTIQRSPDIVGVIRGPDRFFDLAATPDDKTLFVSNDFAAQPGISAYDTTTGARRAFHATHNVAPRLALSPDGHTIAVVDAVGEVVSASNRLRYQVQLLDADTLGKRGAAMPMPPAIEEAPTRLAFSPDGRYIAGVTDRVLAGGSDPPAVALVWDVAKGGEPVLVFAFDAPIRQRDVAFLPDSRAVLIAGPSGTSVVDVATGRESRHIEGAFAPIAVSPDGRRLAAALDPGALVLGTLDPSTGALTARLAGHSERVDRIVFSTDGELVASGDDEGTVMLWDAATGARRSLFDGHAAGVRGLAFTHDGGTLYSSSLDHVVYAWDLRRSRTLAHRLPPDTGDLQPLALGVEEQVISDDGGAVMYLAAGDDRVQFRDTATGALTPPATFGFFLDFSPDARRFVTSPMDGTLKEWDRASQTLVATRSPDAGAYIAAAYTPDGQRLVAAQVDQNNDHPSLDVLDADTLEPVGGQALPIKIWPRAIEVTPDGRRALAVLSAYDHVETKVILVDLSSRLILRSTPVDFGSAARNSTFASDGHTVSVGANTGEVRIVDAETGNTSPPLLAHDGIVESVSFSPDIKTFVTTGRDGAVRLWATATRQLLGEMQPLGATRLVRARFVASNRLLISYSTGELLEWDPQPASWDAYACPVAGRNFTKAEWAELFPDRPYHATCAQFPPGA